MAPSWRADRVVARNSCSDMRSVKWLRIAVNGSVSKTGKLRKTAIDRRTRRHPGYAISQVCRKRIEEVFGWIKAQAGFARSRSGATKGVRLR
jgi:hypothetical protein